VQILLVLDKDDNEDSITAYVQNIRRLLNLAADASLEDHVLVMVNRAQEDRSAKFNSNKRGKKREVEINEFFSPKIAKLDEALD
jgi:hypothetical protein